MENLFINQVSEMVKMKKRISESDLKFFTCSEFGSHDKLRVPDTCLNIYLPLIISRCNFALQCNPMVNLPVQSVISGRYPATSLVIMTDGRLTFISKSKP